MSMTVERPKALVSRCLLGDVCRYDGRRIESEKTRGLAEEYSLVPVCPEQEGGLSTPRPVAEIRGGDGGDVLDGRARVIVVESGVDLTPAFLRGAEVAAEAAVRAGAAVAFLKSRSPSCGCGEIVVGGEKIAGDGVAAALLKRRGIRVEVIVDESLRTRHSGLGG